MFFKHFYDTDLAQGSYLIGCQASGEAIVVDPRRDVRVYLDEAAAQGLRIVAVTETHIHADYLSGSRELAQAAGARLYLSDEGAPTEGADGGEDWSYRFDHVGLRHGDAIRIGNLEIEALHTPGHTPEHLSFLVTDGGLTERPGYLLSGDFVFVGDIGRPDLLDEAAGGVDTRFEGAEKLFASLRDVFLKLPDYVQVWPGHGAGSACGKALGAVASTTVGYERLTAWWRDYLDGNDRDGFVAALLDGQPDAPRYFGRMKRHNRAGPALLGERAPLRRFDPAEVGRRLGADLHLLDTRPEAEQWSGAVPGALTVPGGRSFATYASYLLDPERDARDIVVLAPDAEAAERFRDRLAFVGIDRVVGYLPSLAGMTVRPLPLVSPAELERLDDPYVLDVRTANEYAEGHLPGAVQLHAGRVAWKLDALPRDRRVIVHCQSGARSAVVASLLRNEGFDGVAELEGSYLGWSAYQHEKPEPLTPSAREGERTSTGGTQHVR
jgi:hydroxyacylglutathione hydrolase